MFWKIQPFYKAIIIVVKFNAINHCQISINELNVQIYINIQLKTQLMLISQFKEYLFVEIHAKECDVTLEMCWTIVIELSQLHVRHNCRSIEYDIAGDKIQVFVYSWNTKFAKIQMITMLKKQ